VLSRSLKPFIYYSKYNGLVYFQSKNHSVYLSR